MLNIRRKRNLATFIFFIAIVAWNVKIGLDFLKAEFKLFAVLNFLSLILFFSAVGSSIRSKRKAMEAYQSHVRKMGKSQIEVLSRTESNV